jgi:subtilase family protein/Ig-like domain-containing protein/peptidase inhibitor I9
MRNLFLLLVLLALCLRAGTADADVKPSPYLFRQPDASAGAPAQPRYRGAGEDRIPDQYIVVLSDDVPPNLVSEVTHNLGLSHQFTPRKIWQDAIKGFFAEMPEARARALSDNPLVKYVEENAQWHLSGWQQTNINPVTCDPTVTTCTGLDIVTDNRLWHLDRADQNYPDPTNGYFSCTDGTGITVYVVDTGVNKYQQEFGGRVLPGYNATGTGDATKDDHMPADDPCLGFVVPANTQYPQEVQNYLNEVGFSSHGTAVASAVGGKRVGIAKNVTIVPVKASRCDLFSARVRLSNHFYVQNKTMFHTQSGNGYDALYRCITPNGGTTAPTDPGGWPITAGATIVDGGVTWEVLSSSNYINFATQDMVIDGLNWILSSANTGPKSYAIVTMSIFRRWDQTNGTNGSIETVVRSLLTNNITVIASANNQNGNACDTSPSRLSRNNPDPNIAGDVITAGGSMVINRPWNVNLNEAPAIPSGALEADGGGTKGVEPQFDSTKAVRDARWICGAGDSDTCSNSSPTDTRDPGGSLLVYSNFAGGSNAGPCVTLFAPAKNLFLATTTGNGSDYRDARLRGLSSGTSWSAPIVAGFAARVLQTNTYTPAQVRTALLNNSVATLEDSLPNYPLNTSTYNGTPITGTPNKLLRLGDVNITQQPVSQTATSSDTPTLSAQAAGTSTPTYQWYRVNAGFDLAHWTNGAHFDAGSVGSVGSSSTKILGATSSTYQALASSVTTGYWMRATNSCGSADTNIAVVTIVPCTPPSVNNQPQPVSVPAGTGVTLVVGASGTSLTYQWYVGASGVTSTPVGGATSASVNITPPTTTTYWVQVSNSCGTANSISATVTVVPIVGADFFLITPCRVLDTRGGSPVQPGQPMNVVVVGVPCGIDSNATAAAINVTVVSPSSVGYVTLYPGPANTVRPDVSTINYTAGVTLANNARVTLGAGGSVNIFNAGALPINFIIDVLGYFK